MTVLAHRHGSRRHAHDFEPRHRHLLMPQPAVLEDEVRPQAPDGEHDHDEHGHDHDHGHSHGLIHDSIKPLARRRPGRADCSGDPRYRRDRPDRRIFYPLGQRGAARRPDPQLPLGDALTAIPLGAAFLLRSERAERIAGLFVVAAIFISALPSPGVEQRSLASCIHRRRHIWRSLPSRESSASWQTRPRRWCVAAPVSALPAPR